MRDYEMGAPLTARPHIEDPGPQLGVFMNRAIVKTGAALAVVAGLMGGVAVAPAYAEPTAAEAQQVTQEQLQKLMDEVAALQPNVTAESWVASAADGFLTSSWIAINDGKTADYPSLYKSLEGARDALKPGKNLTLFLDPVTDALKGDNADQNLGVSDLMRAYWLDPNYPAKDPGRGRFSLKNAVNGRANWGSPGVAKLGPVEDDEVTSGQKRGEDQAVYIQFDLGNEGTRIRNFRLWRAPVADGARYANTALVVSNDPKFEDTSTRVVYYSGKDSQDDAFSLKAMPTDPYYTEGPEGMDLLEKSGVVEGRYVRLYMNGSEGSEGRRNQILEIAITGADAVNSSTLYDAKDVEDLEASIARVRALLRDHAGDYSAETVKALEETLAKAEDLLARIKAGTATENLGAASDLNDAIAQAENNLVKAYTVTFDDKIEGTEDIAVEAVEGAAVTLPANPVHPKGYAFEGWFLDKDGKDAFDPVKHTSGDITVYAKWSTPATELKPADPIKPEVKPEEKPEVKPEQKPENGDKPAKGDKLPQTGDASMIAVAASALGSAAAFMAARRRK